MILTANGRKQKRISASIRNENNRAFKQFFRYVPLCREDDALVQLDRALAAVRIQSNIRGVLDRNR